MAMHGLAVLYAKGLGVSQDLVKAYAWNNVSATQGWGMAKTYREELEKMMNRDQLDKAQKMSIELFKKYGTEPKN
jgi:TPR repeat protein